MNNNLLSEEDIKKLNDYYSNCKLWLPLHPNWRIWKFRIDNGTKKGKIVKIKDNIRDEKTLRKWLLKLSPILDVYYSSGCFLDPTKVKGSKTSSYLLFRDIPFDLDADKPYGVDELDIVRISTIKLIKSLRERLNQNPKYILFTGGRGFQVIYEFDTRGVNLIPFLKFKGIDPEVTTDKFRVIRCPLTVNKRGKVAIFLTEKDLNKGMRYILNKSKTIHSPLDLEDGAGRRKPMTNLPPQNLMRRSSESAQTEPPLTISEIKQILLGSLFGDAGLHKRRINLKPPRFAEQHSIKQKEYLLWKKEHLSKLFDLRTNYFSFSDKRTTKEYKGIRILSKGEEILEKYYSYFYPNGEKCGGKIFNIDVLNKLTPLGIAIWFMDDGTFRKRNSSSSIYTNTSNSKIVKEWFKQRWNIESKIYNRKDSESSEIKFDKENTLKLFKLITPYIHYSMIYKVRRSKEELEDIKRKNREYRQSNKERIKEQRRDYREKNKNNIKEYRRKYYKNKQTDSTRAIYVTNEVKGTKRYIPILKFNYREVNPKAELQKLSDKYGLNEWFLIKTNGSVICVSLAALDKRRLSKVLNSTISLTKDEFRKFTKIFMRVSSYEGGLDTPLPIGVVYLKSEKTKNFLYSKPHADMLKYFDFVSNPFMKYIGHDKPKMIEVCKR